jgi:flagellar hook-associated protein 1 FlgK
MSLSKAATIAYAGLRTVTAETSVVARNIAGAQETGHYARRTANVISTTGGPFVGSVLRATSEAIFANLLSSSAAAAAQAQLLAAAENLRQTIGSTADGLPGSSSPAALLSRLVNTLRAYSASPNDSDLAGEAVVAAKGLANALNQATETVQQVRAQADAEIAASVETINKLLVEFQSLNAQVVRGTVAGSDVSDAHDRRDTVLQKLAQEIGISTIAGPNNDISIYTDGGVTLFQGGLARKVTFSPTATFTPETEGSQVLANGVPITGTMAVMPISSGKIAGLADLRDNLSVTYQAQLDNMAGALIEAFAERDQAGGGGPDLPGLFTTPGAVGLPTAVAGLAARIIVNRNADPGQNGDARLVRDGGISGRGAAYVYNTTGEASFQGRIVELTKNLAATRSFGSGTGITESASLPTYAAASVSWLEAERSRISAEKNYQSALAASAGTALSNAVGVNLDQEMSKMLDLEQAYAASAKLVAAIDDMFMTFLNAV